MHELSIMGEVVRIVELTMQVNGLTKVQTVVLQVGELSEIVPHFLEYCYAAASYKTQLEGSSIEVEIIPGIGRCNTCGKVFNIIENDGECPKCSSSDFEITSGKEFLVKQIVAE